MQELLTSKKNAKTSNYNNNYVVEFQYQKVISNDDWSLQSNCIHVHVSCLRFS